MMKSIAVAAFLASTSLASAQVLTNLNANAQTQGQIQLQNQNQAQGQGQAQSVRNSNRVNASNRVTASNSQTVNNSDKDQAPGFAAPALTAFGGCKGSVSGGFSVAGFGAALGSTVSDEDCRRLNNGTWLALQGHADAALALVCANEGVREAMTAVGKTCPGDKPAAPIAAAPVPVPESTIVAAAGKPAWCASWLELNPNASMTQQHCR